MKLSRLLPSTCSALLLSVLACSALAQTDAPEAQWQQRAQAREQARAEIALARQAIEARQQAAEKDCWQRFAVESCLNKVRKAARDETQPLRDRELRLNSEARKDKADERLRAIAQKQREKSAPTPVVARPRDGSETLSTEQRANEAQQRAQEQARRLQAHEAEVAQKQAEQEKARLEALQAQQAKQAAAEVRRASKTKVVEGRKGAPLPIPADVAQP